MIFGMLEPTPVQRRLERAVEQLRVVGQTSPDDLAVFLLDAGSPGVREDPCHCPLANHLGNVLDRDVMVDGVSIMVYASESIDSDADMTLPEELRRFVHAFDQGSYPELDEDYDPDHDGC